jgi:hypothetical protein
MFCVECGCDTRVDARFCWRCGARVERDSGRVGCDVGKAEEALEADLNGTSEPVECVSVRGSATWPPGFKLRDLRHDREDWQQDLQSDAISGFGRYWEAPYVLEMPCPIEEAPISALRAAVTVIVEYEGPVHESEVARRLAFMWLLRRAGRRVQAAAIAGLESARTERILVNHGPFWEPVGGARLRLRIRVSPHGRRPECLPPREIIFGAHGY